MADNVDIDALVMKARATARELNELLASLEKAGVEVSVASRPSPEANYSYTAFTRVCLGLRFAPEDEHYSSAGNAGSAVQAAPTPLGLSYSLKKGILGIGGL
jgi:hypothetical protein